MAVLALAATTYSQEESTVEETLRTLDFASVRVGVANPNKGAKSASRFVEVYGGFSINAIAGCTVTLRNEGMGKRRRFVYDVVIPLAVLNGEGHIGQGVGEVGPPGSDLGQEFYQWSLYFDVKDRSRSIVLYDRILKRVLARGAHVSFSVRERAELDRIDAALKKVVKMCTNKA